MSETEPRPSAFADVNIVKAGEQPDPVAAALVPFTCPATGRDFRVRYGGGAAVTCDCCQVVWQVEAGPPPRITKPAPDDDDDGGRGPVA